MRNFLKIATSLSILMLLLAPISTVTAQTRSIVWQRWDVDIVVTSDGDLLITETQAIEFRGGPFREGFREIPNNFTEGITNFNVYEVISQVSIPLPTHVSRTDTDGGSTLVTWDFEPALDEVRTFIVTYVVSGALRLYESRGEDYCAGGGDSCDILSWHAVPDNHDYSIQSSHVTVTLPAGGEILRDPEALSNATIYWETGRDNLSATFIANESLESGTGIDVRITFAHGAVSANPPNWQTEVDRQIAYEQNVKPIVDLAVGAISIILFIAAFGGLYLLWYLKGRDPQSGPVPEYLTEPPSNLPPGAVGTLLDEKVDMRDITATLIDFARRNYSVLEERQSEGSYGSVKRRFWFKKESDVELVGLRDYERDLFRAFFGRKDERSVSKTLPQGFYNKLPKIREAMYHDVTEAGLFRDRPDRVRAKYIGWGIAILILSGIALLLLSSALSFTSFAICPAFAIAIFGIGLAIISRAMPAKTRDGVQEAAKWWAFRKYLQNIDKYVDIPSVAEQFDKYLPYAVALNLDRKWVHMFSRVETTPVPTWYHPVWVGSGHAPWLRPGTGSSSAGRLQKPAAAGASPTLGEGVAGGLNQMGSGMMTGLNQMSEGLISALNTTGRTFNTPPASSYSGGGSSGWSGGGFSGGGFSGGGFSGGGGSGGFR